MARAGAPAASMACSSASAFITVPSMPIESAVRSRPLLRPWTPRKKLPPPTTMPISTPSREAWAISAASSVRVRPSRPVPCGPARASPESFATSGSHRCLSVVAGALSARLDSAGREDLAQDQKSSMSESQRWFPLLRNRLQAGRNSTRPSLQKRPRDARPLIRKRTCQAVVPPAAATSAAKSCSSFSMPSPSAKRAKPVSFTGAPTLPSISLSTCETDFEPSWI
ncbi:hypothetical protein BTHI11S_03476 [Bosea thiooxidans]